MTAVDNLTSLLPILDYASVAVFAVTGALVASRAQLDIVGFIFIACLTSVGGGTLRDLMINRTIFWIADPWYVGVASATAIIVFFTAHLLESRYRAILWFDAISLAIAVPAGVAAAYSLGFSWPIVLIMGMVTSCLGGLMRDVVCNEVPLVLLEGELYASCALAGAAAFVIAAQFGLSPGWNSLICGMSIFALRAGSMMFGWKLPVYKPRPPRVNPPTKR